MKTTFAEFHRIPAGAPTKCAPLSDIDDLASDTEGKKAPLGAYTKSGDDLHPAAANHVCENPAPLAQVALVDLVNAGKGTTRLVNALNRAHHRGVLPFLTIGDYVAAGHSARDTMLTMRGVGQKVADELDALVLTTLADASNASDRPVSDASSLAAEHASAPAGQFCEKRLAELLDKVPFPSVLYGFALPPRLERSLKELHAAEQLPVRTLRGYLRRKEEVHALLFKQRNCGRKSLVALEDVCASIFHSVLVHCGMNREAAREAVRRLLLRDRDALSTSPGTEFVKTLSGFNCTDTADEAIDVSALSPVEFLSTALANGPTDRERDILALRLGLDGSCGRTLEEIAGEYGLTRERIRQLEKNALRKCRLSANRLQFKRYLGQKQDQIWRLLAGDRSFLRGDRTMKAEASLPALVRLSLAVVFGGAQGWLNRHAKPIEAGWVRSGLPADEEVALVDALSSRPGEAGWRERIEAAVDAAPWPLALRDLADRSNGVPQELIADYLEERYRAVMEDGVVVRLERLGAAERLIYVLRDAGCALHTSQIRARHHKLFGLDISESAIGSTLARLKEALIIERGTYGLYENLNLPAEKVAAIRDQVHAYLDSKGRFISTKVIQADLFPDRPLDRDATLSPYVILGLVQDDERFVVKRGLMVGLQHFDPDETFTSLEDTVHELVAEHGPISVPEIVARMAEERRVFDTTVALVVKGSPEIVAVGKGRYDLATHAFGAEAAIRRLELAVELSLLEGKLSLHGLLTRLRAVGVAENSHLVDSWIRKVPRFAVGQGVVALAQPSPIVGRYQTAFSEVCEPSLAPRINRQRLAQKLRDSEAEELIELDYRMKEASRNDLASDKQGEGIINELLTDFEF